MISLLLTTMFCLRGAIAFNARESDRVYAQGDVNFADCLFQIHGTQFDLTGLRLPLSLDLADSPSYEVSFTTDDG